jgi:hypothetical protein
MTWRAEDIEFDLLAQLSETPVATTPHFDARRHFAHDGRAGAERTNLGGSPFPY